MKTYFIYRNEEIVFVTNKFNKDQLQTAFDNAVKEATEGQEIEYGWSDSKYCYAPSLLVEIKEGKPVIPIQKGNKVFYKPYSFKS
jgi:hypothetical protein